MLRLAHTHSWLHSKQWTGRYNNKSVNFFLHLGRHCRWRWSTAIGNSLAGPHQKSQLIDHTNYQSNDPWLVPDTPLVGDWSFILCPTNGNAWRGPKSIYLYNVILIEPSCPVQKHSKNRTKQITAVQITIEQSDKKYMRNNNEFQTKLWWQHFLFQCLCRQWFYKY